MARPPKLAARRPSRAIAPRAVTMPYVATSLAPAKPTPVFDTYWRFAAERQNIFHRRAVGEARPWTTDPILLKHKFTNAYRASDRVSQYLIQRVIYNANWNARDTVFRVLLFKLFNKIETWEIIIRAFGEPTASDFSVSRYSRLLARTKASGQAIYSGAYIMPSGGGGTRHPDKHVMHLNLLKTMMEQNLPEKIAGAPSMRRVFEELRSYPSIGDFLAYQYAIDLNYTEISDFPECQWVVPGPGAKDGIRKCFSDYGGLNDADLIRFVADRQEAECERVGVFCRTLWGRRLQLIDCQNLFCEVDKYARIAHPEYVGYSGRTRIKRVYRPLEGTLILWYPPKWGINHLIPHQSRWTDDASLFGFRSRV